jgi:hypothetical protein
MPDPELDPVAILEAFRRKKTAAAADPAVNASPSAFDPSVDAAQAALASFRNNRAASDHSDQRDVVANSGYLGNKILSAGGAVPPATVFNPLGSTNVRGELTRQAAGRLALNPHPADATQEANQTFLADAAFRTAHPDVHRAIFSDPISAQRYLGLQRSLAIINHEPASPQEQFAAARSALADYRKAAQAGTLHRPRTPDPNFSPASVSDQSVIDVWAKLSGHSFVAGNDYESLLSTEEQAVARAVDIREFAPFVRNHQAHYVSQNRLSALLGRSMVDPKFTPEIEYDQQFREFDKTASTGNIPRAGSARLDHFAALNPFAQQLSLATQQSAVAAAEAAPKTVTSTIIRSLTDHASPAGIVGYGTKAINGFFGLAGATINAVTGGALEGATDLTPTAWRDFFSNNAYLTALGNVGYNEAPSTRRAEMMNQLLDIHRDAAPEVKAQVIRDHFNATETVYDWLGENTSNWLLNNPDTKQLLAGMTGGLADDPAGGLAAMVGLKYFNSTLSKGLNPLRSKPLASVLSADERAALQAGPSFMHVGLHADQVADAASALRNSDPVVANRYAQRLTDAVNTTGVPLTTSQHAAFRADLDRANAARASSSGAFLDDTARAAMEHLAPYVGMLNPYEQAFVLDGSARLAETKALAHSRENYSRLKEIDPSADVPLPPGKSVIDINQKFLTEHRNQAEFAARKTRLDELLSTANTAAEHESRLLETQKTHAETLHARFRKLFIGGLREETARFRQREFAGYEKETANPEVRTAEYKKVWDALNSPNDTLLDAAMSDPAIRKKISAPPGMFPELGQFAPSAYEPALKRSFVKLAHDYLEAAEAPTRTAVPPNPNPRHGLIDSIHAKLDALEAGTEARLSRQELDALNEGRASRLTQPAPILSRMWGDAASDVVERIARHDEYRESLYKAKTDLDAATYGRGKIAIPAKLRHALAERLEFVDPKTRYASLDPVSNESRISLQEALREFHQDVSKDYKEVMSGLDHLTAFEMSVMRQNKSLRPALERYVRDRYHGMNHDRLANDWRVQQILQQLKLDKLSDADRQQLLRDLKDGTPRSDKSSLLIQKYRLDMLKTYLHEGIISPEYYHSMIRDSYYHGTFDPTTNSKLNALATRNSLNPPSRFALLSEDAGFFQFKIPEEPGEFYVAWKDHTGDFKYKKGFKSPTEAHAFRESLPDSTRSAAVKKNLTFDDKLAQELIGDAGISIADLGNQMGRRIAGNRMSRLLLKAGYIRDAADLGIPPDFKGDYFRQPLETGKEKLWYHVPDSERYPTVAGRWIEAKTWEAMESITRGRSPFDAIRAAFERTREDPVFNEQLGVFRRSVAGIDKIFTGAVHAAGGALASAKILLSLRAHLQGRIGNYFYAHLAGVSLTPEGLGWLARGEREFHRLRAANISDPYLDALVTQGSIAPADGSPLHAILLKETETHWRSVDSLEAQLAQTERGIRDADARGDADSVASQQSHRIALLKRLDDAQHAATEATEQSRLTLVGKGIAEAYKGYTGQPSSTLGRHFWNFYQHSSGDTGMKYAVMKYLHQHEGLSVSEAGDRIHAFFQHYNDVPHEVSEFSRHPLGSKFLSFRYEQARILKNALVHEPGRFAASLAHIYAWNTATLMASGINEREYLQSLAMQAGLKPGSGLEPVFMLTGVNIPGLAGSGEGMYSFSVLPFFTDWLSAHAPYASKMFQGSGGHNAPSWLAREGGQDLVSLIGGAPLAQSLFNLYRGRDDRGDPMSSPADFFSDLYTRLTPDWFPGGKDFQRLGRLTTGTDVDVNSGRRKGLMEFAAGRLFNIYRKADDYQKFAASMAYEAVQSGNTEVFQAREPFDLKLRTQMQRLGPNATEDQKKALVSAHLAANPRLTGGFDDIIETYPNQREQDRIRDVASKPGLEARFTYNSSLQHMIAAYARYRTLAHTPGDVAFDARIRALVDDKLNSKAPITPETIDAIEKVVTSYDQADLTDDARSLLQNWLGRAKAKPFRKYFR